MSLKPAATAAVYFAFLFNSWRRYIRERDSEEGIYGRKFPPTPSWLTGRCCWIAARSCSSAASNQSIDPADHAWHPA
jgi:hypothetical protein